MLFKTDVLDVGRTYFYHKDHKETKGTKSGCDYFVKFHHAEFAEIAETRRGKICKEIAETGREETRSENGEGGRDYFQSSNGLA